MKDIKAVSGLKLIVTIVNKGMASKVVKIAKSVGCEGATIIHGIGTGGLKDWFGTLFIHQEKELVLNIVPNEIADDVIKGIRRAVKLHRRGNGILFSINAMQLAGCVHAQRNQKISTFKSTVMKPVTQEDTYDLIVTIVNKGQSELVIDASKKGGAEGGTVMHGRGSGIHEKATLFSIQIEPEKDIVFTLINRKKTKSVLEYILQEADLDKPGTGIAFVLEVDQTAGINHMIPELVKS